MLKNTLSRRSLLKRSAATAAALGLSGLTAKSYGEVVGSNEDIRIAVIGFNGRGVSHIDAYRRLKGVRLVALCDADEAVLNRQYKRLESGEDMKPRRKRPSTQPTASIDDALLQEEKRETPKTFKMDKYGDVRKLLDSHDIDAVSIATPNHWHALMTVWACQAGKDVYVEKPTCHEVWEGEQAINASRKYNRIVQAGTQWRSMSDVFEAFEWAKAGNIGKILVSRGLCYKRRASIGKTEGPQPIPKTVDYDLWCGPSPKVPLRRKNLHYDWHWVWPTGNGDVGNQGIHQMDLARWALGKPTLAPSVISVGGRLGYVDDGETPNTLMVVHDYKDSLLIFEVRGLPHSTDDKKMDKYRGADIGNIVECEGGYVQITNGQGCHAFDKDDQKIKTFDGKSVERDRNHFANFLRAVRSRRRAEQNAEIVEGTISSCLCHTGNISYRLGKHESPDNIRDAFKADKAAMETFERMQQHLAANDVNISMDELSLGAPLQMDVKKQRFTNNEKANALLTRKYRAPYVVPDLA